MIFSFTVRAFAVASRLVICITAFVAHSLVCKRYKSSYVPNDLGEDLQLLCKSPFCLKTDWP